MNAHVKFVAAEAEACAAGDHDYEYADDAFEDVSRAQYLFDTFPKFCVCCGRERDETGSEQRSRVEEFERAQYEARS